MIEVDNYEEELDMLTPLERPRMMAEVETQIYNWATKFRWYTS